MSIVEKEQIVEIYPVIAEINYGIQASKLETELIQTDRIVEPRSV